MNKNREKVMNNPLFEIIFTSKILVFLIVATVATSNKAD